MSEKNEDKINEKVNISLNSKQLNIFKVVVCILLALYIGYSLINLIRNPTNTFMIEYGKVSLEESAIGYVIKEEYILEDEEATDELKVIIPEGTRVSKGETVFAYVGETNQEISKKLEEINKQIEEALENKKDILPNDINALDELIQDDLIEIRNITDIQKMQEYKTNINSNIEKKAKIIGDNSKAGSTLNNLFKQRETYQKQLNNATKYVKASNSGVVSYRIDDLENVLTPDSINDLTTEFLKSLNLKEGQIIETSKNKAKIINNFKCYLATNVSSDKAMEAKIGNKLSVRFNNNVEIDAQIVNIIEENESRLIVLEVTDKLDYILNYRKISFDVIWWSDEGLKIPLESLANERNYEIKSDDEDETKTITVGEITKVKTGYQEKITVKVLRENEDFVIIDNLTNEEKLAIEDLDSDIQNEGSISLYDEVLKKAE